MKKYLVTWEIDVEDVNTPILAAKKAWKLRNNKDSIANVFTVTDKDTGESYMVNPKSIVKGDWKVFDISNANVIFAGCKDQAHMVALGYNHYYCLPNKPLNYFVMNFLSVFQSIQESNGASYNLHTHELNPSTGYMVALPGYEKVYDIPDNLNRFQGVVFNYMLNGGLCDKINENPDKTFLGFWINDGKLWVDLAENVESYGTAYHLSLFRNQLAFYDCKNKCDMKVNPPLITEATVRGGHV